MTLEVNTFGKSLAEEGSIFLGLCVKNKSLLFRRRSLLSGNTAHLGFGSLFLSTKMLSVVELTKAQSSSYLLFNLSTAEKTRCYRMDHLKEVCSIRI
jgi:hypothetical protein